jgi:hypothetical protein
MRGRRRLLLLLARGLGGGISLGLFVGAMVPDGAPDGGPGQCVVPGYVAGNATHRRAGGTACVGGDRRRGERAEEEGGAGGACDDAHDVSPLKMPARTRILAVAFPMAAEIGSSGG